MKPKWIFAAGLIFIGGVMFGSSRPAERFAVQARSLFTNQTRGGSGETMTRRIETPMNESDMRSLARDALQISNIVERAASIQSVFEITFRQSTEKALEWAKIIQEEWPDIDRNADVWAVAGGILKAKQSAMGVLFEMDEWQYRAKEKNLPLNETGLTTLSQSNIRAYDSDPARWIAAAAQFSGNPLSLLQTWPAGGEGLKSFADFWEPAQLRDAARSNATVAAKLFLGFGRVMNKDQSSAGLTGLTASGGKITEVAAKVLAKQLCSTDVGRAVEIMNSDPPPFVRNAILAALPGSMTGRIDFKWPEGADDSIVRPLAALAEMNLPDLAPSDFAAKGISLLKAAESNNDLRQPLANFLIANALDRGLPDSGLLIASSLPLGERRDELLKTVVGTWVTYDVVGASEFLAAHQDIPVPDEVYRRLIKEIDDDPEARLLWAMKIQDAQIRGKIMSSAFAELSEKEPAKAAAWDYLR